MPPPQENPPRMTQSTSTPRLRFTLFYYVVLAVASAICGPSQPADAWDTLALNTLSFALVTVAILGRVWCSVFIAGHKEEELVTSGPYALCRHPLYALSILGGFGLGIATHTVVLTLITLIVLTLLLASDARKEESRLEARHGEAFRAYARHTPRWLPALRRPRPPLPRRVQLPPDLYWKAFLDAGSFALLYLLIVTMTTLRETGLSPTLLHIP
jgi:protein-S-isoprenylcysteine O-methyltransferase Ste14